MKRMGLGIVYSDYNRLLIDTRKYSYENAKQAVRYILCPPITYSFIFDTIQSKDVFRLINYVPQDVYSALIWYNPNNFTGYRIWKEEMAEGQDSEVLM